MAKGAIDPSADVFTLAKCPLDGCGEELFVVYTICQPLYLGLTTTDLSRPTNDTTWRVECGNGHVLLLPIDSAQEHYEFGSCSCEPGEETDFCQHRDMERLRKLLGIEVRRG